VSDAVHDRRPREISNAELTLADIPSVSAGMSEILDFALTFNGYRNAGSFEACAEIARSKRHDTLSNLRTCLFFAQRAEHFTAHPVPLNPTPKQRAAHEVRVREREAHRLDELRQLIALIRDKVSRGELE